LRERSRIIHGPSILRLGLETIPYAANGAQVTRLRWLLLNVAAQPDDEVIDGARIGILPHAPNLLQHGFPRNSLAFVANQVAKEVRLHQRQLQRAVSDVQLESVEVHHLSREKVTVLTRRARRVLQSTQPFGPAQQSANAGDQNGQLER